MKYLKLIGAVLLLSASHLCSQKSLDVGIGYLGAEMTSPRIHLQISYDPGHSEKFSLPVNLTSSFTSLEDYNSLTIDLQKGIVYAKSISLWLLHFLTKTTNSSRTPMYIST